MIAGLLAFQHLLHSRPSCTNDKFILYWLLNHAQLLAMLQFPPLHFTFFMALDLLISTTRPFGAQNPGTDFCSSILFLIAVYLWSIHAHSFTFVLKNIFFPLHKKKKKPPAAGSLSTIYIYICYICGPMNL